MSVPTGTQVKERKGGNSDGGRLGSSCSSIYGDDGSELPSPTQGNKDLLRLVLECLNPTMFNWVETMTINMKKQLTNCRRGETKQFGYGSILIPHMLEWVLALQL